MRFRDREEAARLLAGRLAHLEGRRPLVLAIPRGAVPMGSILAEALGGELDVVLVHKIGAPGNPEYAVGAVSETGDVSVRPEAELEGVPRSWIDAEAARVLESLRERRRRYTPDRPPVDAAGRVVVVVDDGIATGATFEAALTLLRRQGPERLVAAVAVAPRRSLERLRPLADEVVCLDTPEPFFAVGQFFDDFRQVGDEEVLAILRASREVG